jgi:hypothetical protein
MSKKLIQILVFYFVFCGNLIAAEIYKKDLDIIIKGEIKEGDAKKFEQALSAGKAASVRVSSNGGDAEEAIEIGKLIKKLNLNVTVSGLCASSCANYIFTAANIKVVEVNSFIIWHGSPSTGCEHTFPDATGMKENELMALNELINNIRNKSDLFFREIKVSPLLTCLDKESYSELDDNIKGFTMTSQAMRNFGVNNVYSKSEPSSNFVSNGKLVAFIPDAKINIIFRK